MFGDGSQGSLTVTSGNTVNLALNTKHQFTTVDIQSGGVLSTSSTTGSVLYILATTSVNIAGTINVSNKVNAGQNSWSTTIDGVTYSSPSTANGGSGGNSRLFSGGSQGLGFGGGGAGGAWWPGGSTGNGGNGGTPGGFGGSGGGGGGTSSRYDGGNGGTSAGGGGAAFNNGNGASYGASGGNAYGNNGGNASIVNGNNGSESAGGGGGAGGRAGRAGVHIVIKAPIITIGGSIITSGTAGTNGGNGGSGASDGVDLSYLTGGGGGGGGGGNAGNVYVYYDTSYSNTGTITISGGIMGFGGSGAAYGSAGGVGSAGVLIVTSTEEHTQSGYSVITEPLSFNSNGAITGGYGAFGFGAIFGGEAQTSGLMDHKYDQSGFANIKVTNSVTQTGTATIASLVTKTQSGYSRIQTSSLKTQLGYATIQYAYLKEQLGFASIKGTTSRTQTGYARIQHYVSKTQPGYANILSEVSNEQTGFADIFGDTIHDQGGYANIILEFSYDISGYSYIYDKKTLPGDFIRDNGDVYIKEHTIDSGVLGASEDFQYGVYIKEMTNSSSNVIINDDIKESGVYIKEEKL